MQNFWLRGSLEVAKWVMDPENGLKSIRGNKGGHVSAVGKRKRKFWWQLFLAMEFTFLFLNLAKIYIFIPKFTEVGGGGGSTGLGYIPITIFLVLP